MRIILCLNRDIHAALALNLLFPKLKSHQVKIILSENVGKKSNLAKEIIELKKYEQEEINKIFAQIENSQTLDDKYLAPSKKFLTFNQIADFFHNKIAIHQSINSPEALADLQNFNPDLIISIRYGNIFHPPAISIPKHGIINLHSGLIPKYRGIMSSFWAILNGENQLGCSLHYIDNAKIDFGRIISFSAKKLQRERSFIFNVAALYDDGCRMIVDAMQKISLQENIKTIDPEKCGEINYFSIPQKNDVEKFCQTMPLITQQDVAELYGYWI